MLTGCLKCEPRPEEKLGRLQMECFVVGVEIQTEMFSWSWKTNRLSIAQTFFAFCIRPSKTFVDKVLDVVADPKTIQLLNNIRRFFFSTRLLN